MVYRVKHIHAMKKKVLLMAALIYGGSFYAQQIPNAGFEDWHSFFNSQAPDYWTGTNQLVIAGASPGIEPSIDAHSGQYAALFSTVVMSLPGNETYFPSLLYINSEAETDDDGMPFTHRPDSMVAWVKYFPNGQNQFLIRADLLKYDPSTQENSIIGTAGTAGISMGNAYTRISFPFDYFSTEIPDTLTLMIASSVLEPTLDGTFLYVDDIEFIYTSTADISENNHLFTINPNPANDFINIKSTAAIKSIEIVDLNGKIVLTIQDPMAHSEMSISELNAGVFICRVTTFEGLIYQEKIIKQ
jgi:hypothetical protein